LTQIKSKAPVEIEPAILEGLQKIPKFLEELQENEEDDATYLQRGLKYYEKFKQQTGLVIIPKGHMEGDFDLSRWDKSVSTRKSLSEKFKEEVLKVDRTCQHLISKFFPSFSTTTYYFLIWHLPFSATGRSSGIVPPNSLIV